MSKKVLITGITGFAGSHLAELCLSKGDQVFGTYRWRSRMENILHIQDQIILIECDLIDSDSVNRLIWRVKPDVIFHLAAQSFVPMSWEAPEQTLTNNIISELNIFNAVRRTRDLLKLIDDRVYDPIIQVAGSSEEYGLVYENETPITEGQPLRPLSPYGVSKVAQDLLAYQQFKSYGIKTIRTRAFNHEGARRGDVFVISNWAKQIAEMEAGLREPILKHGDLTSVRDFTAVQDTVAAYYLLTEAGTPGEEYNIATGVGYTMGDILARMLGMAKIAIAAESDPSRMRPSDVKLLVGDNSKICALGWDPTRTIDDILAETLDYWRSHYEQKRA